MRTKFCPLRAIAAFTFLALAGSAHAEPGSVGFSIAVSTNGIFSPTLNQAKITAVRPGSPAETAGIKKDDLITQIEDCKIPGCPGSTAKTLLDKEAGQVLKLKVKTEGQTERDAIITLGKKPS